MRFVSDVVFPLQGPVPPEGPGLWGHGHMSKGMFYMVVAGILVDTSCCFWCLCALNFLVDLVFVTCCYYGVSPLGAGAPRGSGALGARAHVERNALHFRGKYFGRHALMSLVSRCFEFASSPTNPTSPTTPTNPRPHKPPQRVCGLWRWC